MFNKFLSWLHSKLPPLRVDKRQGALVARRILGQWNKSQIIEFVIHIMMHSETPRHDWFNEFLMWKEESKRLRQILLSEYHTEKNINRAKHVADLESKVKKLKKEVRHMQVCAERHNLESYATGLIVNCTGCEAGKPFEGENLTEEKVREVETIAMRLRTWFDNHQWRKNSD